MLFKVCELKCCRKGLVWWLLVLSSLSGECVLMLIGISSLEDDDVVDVVDMFDVEDEENEESS